MDNFYKIKNSENPKVMAMLSGGKDSIAAILLLRKNGIDVTAIHFIHKWTATIPTNEAKRICIENNIPLIIKDYTNEFCRAVNGYTAGRPCLICKKQMYKLLLKYLKSGRYGWLCIGDNSNDKTTIARINQYISDNHPEDSLMCSGYFGSEMGIMLPKNMKVIRPLIDMTTKDVENFLVEEKVLIKRINSTGDKYFEYHREGCPIQFADVGVELNESLYLKLKIYNDTITEFARKNGILASIHIPSTFIVTIPRGYEEEAAMYLEKRGLCIDKDINSVDISYDKSFQAIVFDLDKKLYTTKAYEKMFKRILERLELFSENLIIKDNNGIVVCHYSGQKSTLAIYFNFDVKNANVSYSFSNDSLGIKSRDIFDNLILETFRTRKYKTYEYY